MECFQGWGMVPHERYGAEIRLSVLSVSLGAQPGSIRGDHLWANIHQLQLRHRRGSCGRSWHRWAGMGRGGGGTEHPISASDLSSSSTSE